MENKLQIKPGETITIHPLSDRIYHGSYRAKVIDYDNGRLIISMPYSQGKLVPLAAGTKVEASIKDIIFQTQILSRKFGYEKSLVLAAPEPFLPDQRIDSEPEYAIADTRVISITSGKGGVGKSSLAINLAISLSKQGKRVCLVDADLGMANIDVLLKMTPKYNLTHIINEGLDIFDVVEEGPENLLVIPGGTGWQDIANLDDDKFKNLIKAFNKLEQFSDIIIFDTGAGINRHIINFLLASDEIILVTTPEPHAITDAYAMTKTVIDQDKELPVKLIVNKASSPQEGKDVGSKISFAARQFLGIPIEFLGFIQENQLFSKSVRNQTPVISSWPYSLPSREINGLAVNLAGKKDKNSHRGLVGFVKKLAGFLRN